MSETIETYDERSLRSRGKSFADAPEGEPRPRRRTLAPTLDDVNAANDEKRWRDGRALTAKADEPVGNGGLSPEAAETILALAARADAAEEELREVTSQTADQHADDLYETATEALSTGQPVDGAAVASALLKAGGGLDEYGLDWRTDAFVEHWAGYDPQGAQDWYSRMEQAQHAIIADQEQAQLQRERQAQAEAQTKVMQQFVARYPVNKEFADMMDEGLRERARTDPAAVAPDRLAQTLDEIRVACERHARASRSNEGRYEFKSGFQREMALSGKLGADVREAQIAAERAARLALREPTLQDTVDTAAARRPATADEKAAAVAAFKAELKETARNKFSEGSREAAARAERAQFEADMEKKWQRGRQ